jgi:crotonobetainyl-CoA:carnitine CoA-transferase CaiB-like acyl-CoA transferase
LSQQIALRDVTVAVEESATAAGATRELLRALDAAVMADEPSTAGSDIVITGSARARTTSPVRILTKRRNDSDDPSNLTPVSPAGGEGRVMGSEVDPSLGFGPAAEMLTAAHAVLIALAGLYAVRRGAPSIAGHVAMDEVMATCATDLLLPVLCHRTPLPRRPPSDRTLVVPCLDGAVSLTLTSDEDLAELGRMIGLDAPLPRDELHAHLSTWARNVPRNDIVRIGQAWRMPVLPVQTPDEIAFSQSPLPFRLLDSQAAVSRRLPEPPAGKPLTGTQVLDLGMVWAGPYCGRLLAGLGASVVKIEGPRRLDGTRPPDDWRGCSGFFGDLNSSKSSLALDLSSDTGRETFLRLARRVDVVVENFSPRVMPNFVLEYAALSGVNPRLIQLSMPAFESDGPHRDFVGYGSGLELAAGLGTPSHDGVPRPARVPYLDLLSGAYGAIAVVTSLLNRDRHPAGSHVEVAQHAVGRHLALWCADDLWPEQTPHIDAPTIIHDFEARSDLFSHAEQEGYCQHLNRCPWALQGTEVDSRPAPRFGADSRRILRDLGNLADDQIEELLIDGVAIAAACNAEFIPRRRALWQGAMGTAE